MSHKSECQLHVLIYWVSVAAVLEGSFPDSNLTYKENFSRLLFILRDMFGKAEMRVKR